MRQILDFSNEPVAISSLRDQKLIEVNAAFLERTGYTREEVIGRSSVELGLLENESVYRHLRQELESTGMVKRRTIRFKCKNGALGLGNISSTVRRFDGQPCIISFISDITESVRAQEELRRSERRFRSYIEHASDGLTVLDRDGQITFAAPSVELLLGFSPEQVVGTNYRTFVHSEDLARVVAAMEMLEGSVRGEPLTFRVQHRDGHWIFIEGIATIIPQSEEEQQQTVFNWRDVTQRKLDEERLRNVERRLRDIISHAPIVVNEFDANGIMTMSEGNAVPSEDVGAPGIGKSMYDLFADSREIVEALDGVLRGETVTTVAEVNNRWFDIWGQPVRNADRKVRGGIAVSTDVTARVLAEQDLQQEKEQFRVLVENASDLILMMNREGTMEFLSPSAERLTGYQIEELVGKNAFDAVHPDDAPGVRAAAAKAFLLPDSTFGIRFRALCKNGEWRRFEAKGKVLPGHPDRMIIEERDVTEQEQHEADLASARDAALESSRLKSAFLANMSHEIRTPLNVILGYLEVIGDYLAEIGDNTQRDHLEAAAKAGQRLIQTMNGILDYSRVESGGFDCTPELLHLSILIEHQIEEFRALANRKGIDLRFVNEAPRARIMADEYCISAAMQNLIGNAIKFTRRGSVEVRLFRSEGDLCVEVRDTGVGISAQFLPKLFQPFVQEESGFSRQFEGSGLGLALTERFLEANHARISVKSVKGAGSTFTIHFSAQDEATNGKAGYPISDAQPDLPRLLLVEDDPDTQAMMRTMLHNIFDLRVAASSAAVRKAIAEKSPIEGVLLDISLKGEEDGLSITRFLRSQPRFHSTPIIAVTAHTSMEHQRLAMEAGCDKVLTKPVKRAQIVSALAQGRRPTPLANVLH
jgi:PAS domain S-box-containing protein